MKMSVKSVVVNKILEGKSIRSTLFEKETYMKVQSIVNKILEGVDVRKTLLEMDFVTDKELGTVRTKFDTPEVKVIDAELLPEEMIDEIPSRLLRIRDKRLWDSVWVQPKDNYSFISLYDNGELVWVDSHVAKMDHGVRPVITLSKDLKVGKKIKFAGQTWTVIKPRKALCDYIVGECPWIDKNSTGDEYYGQSVVKKYVDNWFNKHKNDWVYFIQ